MWWVLDNMAPLISLCKVKYSKGVTFTGTTSEPRHMHVTTSSTGCKHHLGNFGGQRCGKIEKKEWSSEVLVMGKNRYKLKQEHKHTLSTSYVLPVLYQTINSPGQGTTSVALKKLVKTDSQWIHFLGVHYWWLTRTFLFGMEVTSLPYQKLKYYISQRKIYSIFQFQFMHPMLTDYFEV